MVNYSNPVVIERDALGLVKVAHASAGIFIWEFVTTLHYDWYILTGKRPRTPPSMVYLLARFTTLVSYACFMFGFNAYTKYNCKGVVWVAAATLSEVAVALLLGLNLNEYMNMVLSLLSLCKNIANNDGDKKILQPANLVILFLAATRSFRELWDISRSVVVSHTNFSNISGMRFKIGSQPAVMSPNDTQISEGGFHWMSLDFKLQASSYAALSRRAAADLIWWQQSETLNVASPNISPVDMSRFNIDDDLSSESSSDPDSPAWHATL
ncbi:hypothetical protein FISHEDRAFT_78324 [Fistulina hepatica ATCC 64428]|nr:hypothetical protein FISHEDRAFT_78324 [Fistulina hepatica ATCC 64428]